MFNIFKSVLQKEHQDKLQSVVLLAGLAFIFNVGLSLSGYYNWNYDSWNHMFFASHYMSSWFDTWDLRWFGGMSVQSYPPLVTQLLGLGGFVFGIENTLIALGLIMMIMVPIAVYSFSLCFLSNHQATWAGLLSILLPSIYITNYTYGQLPTIFALVTTLFMGRYLWYYVKTGRFTHALIAALLFGITAASHQFTFICFVPILIVCVSLTIPLYFKTSLKGAVKRIGIFLLIGMPLAIIPIFPFWQFLLHAVPQTSIPHLSRSNLFSNSSAFLQFFLAPYLLFLFTIPIAAFSVKKNRAMIPVFAIFILLFLLGLGGSTPIPGMIFGDWWQWLTYDRFSLWAGVLLLIPLSSMIPSDILNRTNSTKSAVKLLFILMLIFLIMGAAYFGTDPSRGTFLPKPQAVKMDILVDFINKNVGQQYRYITLGFGEAQQEKLSSLTHSSSLDGGYFTARTLPVLTESGIGMIDTIKHIDPELKTLDKILANAELYSLKWVFVNDAFYNKILEKNGFYLQFTEGGVTIWVKNEVPPLVDSRKHEIGVKSYIWGLAPLMLVVFLIAIFLKEYVGYKR